MFFCFFHAAPPEKAKDEFDPIALEEVKCAPPGFTKWDRTWIDRGDLTMGEFLKAFKDVTGEGTGDTEDDKVEKRKSLLYTKKIQLLGKGLEGVKS